MRSARALDNSWAQVRKLAEKHPDEWEGQDLQGEAPLRVFVGTGAPRRVLVVTKEAPVARWNRSAWPAGLVVVVASGMLSRAQATAIAALAGGGSGTVTFVGDADPMDLHTFLSLRAHLGPERARFCGVSDGILDAMGDPDVEPERLRPRDLSAFDKAHLQVVQALVDPEVLLGPRVAAALLNGKGLEIEALSFRPGLMPALFAAALKLASRRSAGPGGARKRVRRTRKAR